VAYRKWSVGKRVLTRLTVLTGENARFDAASDWARAVWAMLVEHFPQYSQRFYGSDTEAFSGALFPVSCRAEIDAMNGHVEAYVEIKLQFLHDLLHRYDVAG
jgi:hypothetical protein